MKIGFAGSVFFNHSDRTGVRSGAGVHAGGRTPGVGADGGVRDSAV